jgi:hypothetical protein
LNLADLRCQHGSLAPSSVLQNLTELQKLSVSVPRGPGLTDFLQHVGSLKALQQLNILDYHSSRGPLSPESMPGFSSLAALTNLSLTGSQFDVELLLPCTQLHSLKLFNVSTVQDGGALLSCIGRMTRLQAGPRLLYLDIASIMLITLTVDRWCALTVTFPGLSGAPPLESTTVALAFTCLDNGSAAMWHVAGAPAHEV